MERYYINFEVYFFSTKHAVEPKSVTKNTSQILLNFSSTVQTLLQRAWLQFLSK